MNPKNQVFEQLKLGRACFFDISRYLGGTYFFDINRYLRGTYFDIVWGYHPPGTPQKSVFNLFSRSMGLLLVSSHLVLNCFLFEKLYLDYALYDFDSIL